MGPAGEEAAGLVEAEDDAVPTGEFVGFGLGLKELELSVVVGVTDADVVAGFHVGLHGGLKEGVAVDFGVAAEEFDGAVGLKFDGDGGYGVGFPTADAEGLDGGVAVDDEEGAIPLVGEVGAGDDDDVFAVDLHDAGGAGPPFAPAGVLFLADEAGLDGDDFDGKAGDGGSVEVEGVDEGGGGWVGVDGFEEGSGAADGHGHGGDDDFGFAVAEEIGGDGGTGDAAGEGEGPGFLDWGVGVGLVPS